MDRPPMRPIYIVLLDATPLSLKSGFLDVVVRALSEAISREELPGWELALFALVTFHSSLHFYNLRPTLHSPHIYVLSDLSDLFLPALKDDLLVPLEESKALILSLLASLPTSLAASSPLSPDPPCCVVAAIKAAQMLIGHNGGRLFLFQASRQLSVEEIDLAGQRRI